MPQPATHYLVTRRAIPREHWSTWWDKYKPYFGLGSSAPDLFYFPLLPNVVKNIRTDVDWGEIANPLHSSRSYDMFCALLATAKNNKLKGQSDAEKQFAFAFGYYCHVVTDCIFHPYVYRSTNDHWNSIDFTNEFDHKIQELSIDTGIFQKFYDKAENFSRIQWECNGEDETMLDSSIANLLDEALQEIYPDCYPHSNLSAKDHPIHQAYYAMVQSIRSLFEGTDIYLWGKRIPIDTAKIRSKFPTHFFTTPYPHCPTLDDYTPEDLFNFASTACRNIFIIALDFWNSQSTSAKDYFKSNSTHYLNCGNWNLDTGLPCHYNNFNQMRNEDSEHYSFKSNELKEIYLVLREEYYSSDLK